jgi:hypothetical protein
VTPCQQCPDQMTADEPIAAGDEYFHLDRTTRLMVLEMESSLARKPCARQPGMGRVGHRPVRNRMGPGQSFKGVILPLGFNRTHAVKLLPSERLAA